MKISISYLDPNRTDLFEFKTFLTCVQKKQLLAAPTVRDWLESILTLIPDVKGTTDYSAYITSEAEIKPTLIRFFSSNMFERFAQQSYIPENNSFEFVKVDDENFAEQGLRILITDTTSEYFHPKCVHDIIQNNI